jgi:hypothetical protein
MSRGAIGAPADDVVTFFGQLELAYGGWLVICGLGTWYLARWSARRQLNGLIFALLVLIALINLAQIGYILVLGESIITRPRNPFEKFLQHTDKFWFALYLLWPFATAIGVAQTSIKIKARPVLARWVSFGCSVAIAALTPLTLIFIVCGLAGACL